MKKFLFFSLIAIAALTVSCKKDNKDIIDDEPDAPKVERLAQIRDAWDWWDFIYENNKIVKIDRCKGARVWDFAWNGNSCTVTGQDNFTFELGANGMVSKMTWGEEVRTYTYDAAGFLTEVKLNNETVATLTISNGLITKLVEGENVTEFEYSSDANPKGYQLWYDDHDDKIIKSWHRFLIESGLFGKAPEKIVSGYTKTTEIGDGESGTLEGLTYDVFTKGEDIHKYVWAEL